eukprot:TRINITY_DN61943_c0_g1_i2.p2 TRINITY_DN61943_c0_g1~~TRINITY_DN61943_c0_g1_i2.p2  ORF type:complete len:183 (-),score=27.50 TRINITY_DN61943_c0_g1_i2:198-746(-)
MGGACSSSQKPAQAHTTNSSNAPVSKDYVSVGVLGGTDLAKTRLVSTYIHGRDDSDYDPTVELEFNKNDTVNGELLRVRVYNIANTMDRSDRDEFIADSDGFVLVFSAHDRESFEEISALKSQIADVRKQKAAPAAVLLAMEIGSRQVSKDEGSKLASKLYEKAVPYFELESGNPNIEQMQR